MKTTKKRVVRAPSSVAKTHDKVRARDLNVDPDVQRMQDPKQVDKLEIEFDELFAGTLVISKRADGTLWVVDGQHRKEAGLRIDPNIEFDAEIYEGLTKRQEAIMFLRLNKHRKPVRPFDSYNVSLTAGLDLEVRVQAQVTACGLRVASSSSANQVGAVEACRSIVLKDKLKSGLLQDTLLVNESAWGRSPESWDNMILRAVATVIHKNRSNIDLKRLSKILQKRHPGTWKGAAVSMAPGGGGSESRSNRLVEVIVTAYNTGLRTKANFITA